MNCDKYKRKAFYGSIIIFLMATIKPITLSIINLRQLLGVEMFILLVLILGVLGLYLLLPYFRCLKDYNTKYGRK